MSDHYILDDRHRTIPTDLLGWGKWFEEHGKDRIVQKNHVAGFLVSTVFLGLDHSFGVGYKKLLFETMVFPPGGHGELHCNRYSTWKQAERGHAGVWKRLTKCRTGVGFAGRLDTARRILHEFGASDEWEKVAAALWAGKGHL